MLTVVGGFLVGGGGVAGGDGSDTVYDDRVCPGATTVKHLIMGAVSLWTRPPALYLCAGP